VKLSSWSSPSGVKPHQRSNELGRTLSEGETLGRVGPQSSLSGDETHQRSGRLSRSAMVRRKYNFI